MFLFVKVFPGSRRASVIRKKDGSLEVRITVRPEDGKANKEARKAVAKFINVPFSLVKIIKGEKSKNKLFDVPLETDDIR
jgi:uncharacterized protein